jgi:hypothetical protein
MPRRSRIVAFGSAGMLVVAGAICGVLVGGLAGQVLAIALIATGLGGALLLVFLEVGLSEEQDRARDEEVRRRRTAKSTAAPRPAPRRSRRRRGP